MLKATSIGIKSKPDGPNSGKPKQVSETNTSLLMSARKQGAYLKKINKDSWMS